MAASGRETNIEVTLNDAAPLGVTWLKGTEGLSKLFRFQVEFLSSESLTVAGLMNKSAKIRIWQQASSSDVERERYVHGIVSRFTYLGQVAAPGNASGNMKKYRAEIVPWLWLLTQKTNCRIFQGKSIPEIVGEILGEYAGTVNQQAVSGSYPVFEFRVQYRESDFAFISRLLEESGIFYYFRHTEDSYEMVLADSVTGYFACEETAVRFGNASTGSTGDHIQSWEHDYAFRSGSFTYRDFDFENPTTDLTATSNSLLSIQGADATTLYDYPGGYKTTADGNAYAGLRMQEQEASFEVIRADGISPCFVAGARFVPANHPELSERVEFVITSVEHETSAASEGVRSDSMMLYQNHFECIPATVPRIFRPPRQTPRPFVRGVQTAIVTGPDGETIHTDEYGRVKVQFHWDRVGTNTDESSCWIRVSQAWAGSSYGSVLLPHVGHEVIVSFLEGDPDRPLITGRVYNADNMPPETLPDKKNRAIVAQDDVGNIIALDADEMRVDIQNAQDKFELTVGESISATAGMDLGITLGCGLGFNLGASLGIGLAASVDLSVGMSSSVFAGGSYDASFGGSFSYAKGNFVNAGDSVGQIAFQNAAEFVSHESTMIAGGSGTNNGVVMVSSDRVVASFGPTDVAFKGNPAKALALGVFGASIAGTLGIAAAATTAFLGAKASEKGEFDGYAGGAVASGIGAIAGSATAGALLKAYAKTWSVVKQSVHAAPKSQMILNDSLGGLYSDTEVLLLSTGDVNLTAGGAVNVLAAKADMSGDLNVQGKFTSPNIEDLGDPSAAPAAQGEANGAVAEFVADAALAAATHIAEQVADVALAASE